MVDSIETKKGQAKNLRFRKPIVKDLNIESIKEHLWEISCVCDDVKYYLDDDEDSLLDSLIGEDEDESEFKMMFADLSAECEQMLDDMNNCYVPECFDNFFVAIGAGEHGGGLLGWDSFEQDYLGIDYYPSSEDICTKRLLRFNKTSLVEAAQVCFRIMYSYLGLRHRYDCIKAALDILKDENTGYLQMVRRIEETYERANNDHFYNWYQSTKELESLINAMPYNVWLY